MQPTDRHAYQADVTFDGGDLDCGSGLLLLIRKHMDPLDDGALLEIMSTEQSVDEDLPAWCRLTGNTLVSWTRHGQQRSFLISKGVFISSRARTTLPGALDQSLLKRVPVTIPTSLPLPTDAPQIAPLSVTGVGSWPRPSWLMRALHESLQGRLSEEEFQSAADDAVRLCVDSQLRAGCNVITDGEQRRDNYASFLGGRLDNCILVPLADLVPLVDDPEQFRREMQSLDVSATKVRHPVVFGKLGRSKPLALHEFEFVRSISDKPVKIALPGPYLLTRMMWMDCFVDKAYDSREQLAADVVRVLREELHFLLAAGVSLVQIDEPVLTEVVYSNSKSRKRTFMCGALSERGDVSDELEFAGTLINELTKDLPAHRLALHVCRGNWSPDETVALSGDYRPLLPLFDRLNVGTLFLEFCTPRAGDFSLITELPRSMKLGLGAVNPKASTVESVEEILQNARSAIKIVGHERLLLNPDCGFATFADNPVCTVKVAEAKMKALALAAGILQEEYNGK